MNAASSHINPVFLPIRANEKRAGHYRSGSADYWIPPVAAAENASQARRAINEGSDAMRDTGRRRMRQLEGREKLDREDIIEIDNWFARHAAYVEDHKPPPEPSNSWVSWKGWGGDEMRDFAARERKKIDAGDYDMRENARRNARHNAGADTPAPPEDQIKGSDTNEPGSASEPNADIELGEKFEKGLKNKLKKYREEHPDTDVTLATLKSVARRGMGAYSTSHRPGVSRSAWAYARVDKFLDLAAEKLSDRQKYDEDYDLLPTSHPDSTRENRLRPNPGELADQFLSIASDAFMQIERGEHDAEKAAKIEAIIYALAAKPEIDLSEHRIDILRTTARAAHKALTDTQYTAISEYANNWSVEDLPEYRRDWAGEYSATQIDETYFGGSFINPLNSVIQRELNRFSLQIPDYDWNEWAFKPQWEPEKIYGSGWIERRIERNDIEPTREAIAAVVREEIMSEAVNLPPVMTYYTIREELYDTERSVKDVMQEMLDVERFLDTDGTSYLYLTQAILLNHHELDIGEPDISPPNNAEIQTAPDWSDVYTGKVSIEEAFAAREALDASIKKAEAQTKQNRNYEEAIGLEIYYDFAIWYAYNGWSTTHGPSVSRKLNEYNEDLIRKGGELKIRDFYSSGEQYIQVWEDGEVVSKFRPLNQGRHSSDYGEGNFYLTLLLLPALWREEIAKTHNVTEAKARAVERAYALANEGDVDLRELYASAEHEQTRLFYEEEGGQPKTPDGYEEEREIERERVSMILDSADILGDTAIGAVNTWAKGVYISAEQQLASTEWNRISSRRITDAEKSRQKEFWALRWLDRMKADLGIGEEPVEAEPKEEPKEEPRRRYLDFPIPHAMFTEHREWFPDLEIHPPKIFNVPDSLDAPAKIAWAVWKRSELIKDLADATNTPAHVWNGRALTFMSFDEIGGVTDIDVSARYSAVQRLQNFANQLLYKGLEYQYSREIDALYTSGTLPPRTQELYPNVPATIVEIDGLDVQEELQSQYPPLEPALQGLTSREIIEQVQKLEQAADYFEALLDKFENTEDRVEIKETRRRMFSGMRFHVNKWLRTGFWRNLVLYWHAEDKYTSLVEAMEYKSGTGSGLKVGIIDQADEWSRDYQRSASGFDFVRGEAEDVITLKPEDPLSFGEVDMLQIPRDTLELWHSFTDHDFPASLIDAEEGEADVEAALAEAEGLEGVQAMVYVRQVKLAEESLSVLDPVFPSDIDVATKTQDRQTLRGSVTDPAGFWMEGLVPDVIHALEWIEDNRSNRDAWRELPSGYSLELEVIWVLFLDPKPGFEGVHDVKEAETIDLDAYRDTALSVKNAIDWIRGGAKEYLSEKGEDDQRAIDPETYELPAKVVDWAKTQNATHYTSPSRFGSTLQARFFRTSDASLGWQSTSIRFKPDDLPEEARLVPVDTFSWGYVGDATLPDDAREIPGIEWEPVEAESVEAEPSLVKESEGKYRWGDTSYTIEQDAGRDWLVWKGSSVLSVRPTLDLAKKALMIELGIEERAEAPRGEVEKETDYLDNYEYTDQDVDEALSLARGEHPRYSDFFKPHGQENPNDYVYVTLLRPLSQQAGSMEADLGVDVLEAEILQNDGRNTVFKRDEKLPYPIIQKHDLLPLSLAARRRAVVDTLIALNFERHYFTSSGSDAVLRLTNIGDGLFIATIISPEDPDGSRYERGGLSLIVQRIIASYEDRFTEYLPRSIGDDYVESLRNEAEQKDETEPVTREPEQETQVEQLRQEASGTAGWEQGDEEYDLTGSPFSIVPDQYAEPGGDPLSAIERDVLNDLNSIQPATTREVVDRMYASREKLSSSSEEYVEVREALKAMDERNLVNGSKKGRSYEWGLTGRGQDARETIPESERDDYPVSFWKVQYKGQDIPGGAFPRRDWTQLATWVEEYREKYGDVPPWKVGVSEAPVQVDTSDLTREGQSVEDALREIREELEAEGVESSRIGTEPPPPSPTEQEFGPEAISREEYRDRPAFEVLASKDERLSESSVLSALGDIIRQADTREEALQNAVSALEEGGVTVQKAFVADLYDEVLGRRELYKQLPKASRLMVARYFAPPAPLHKTIDFGKYSGSTIREIVEQDRGYAEWATENLDNRPEILAGFVRGLEAVEYPDTVSGTPRDFDLSFRVRGGGEMYDGITARVIEGSERNGYVDATADNRTRSGRSGSVTFELEDGAYELTETSGSIKNQRQTTYYVAVQDGEIFELDSRRDAQAYAEGASLSVNEPETTDEATSVDASEELRDESPEVEASAFTVNVENVPIEDIYTDEERFQPREAQFSEETAAKIAGESFDPQLFDPVDLWRDPKDDRLYMLAGHSRLEGMRRRGVDTIPAEIKDFSETDAIRYALVENDKGTNLTNRERAGVVRTLRESGELETQAAQKEFAQENYGRNARVVFDLSWLDPQGKMRDVLASFEGSSSQDYRDAETMAQYIGKMMRLHRDDFTRSHENEMTNWLIDNYRDKGRKIRSFEQFRKFVEDVKARQSTMGAFGGFDSSEPLNLASVRPQSRQEQRIDEEVQKARARFEEVQEELQDTRAELVQRRAQGETVTQDDFKRILRPLELAVQNAQQKYLKTKEEAQGAKKAAREAQSDLFAAARANAATPVSLVHIGTVTHFIATGTGSEPSRISWRAGEKPDFMYMTLGGDALVIVPPDYVTVTENMKPDADADSAWAEWHHMQPKGGDHDIQIPVGTGEHVGHASKIHYSSDKLIEKGDRRGVPNRYYHDFTEGEHPVREYPMPSGGVILVIGGEIGSFDGLGFVEPTGSLEIDGRGILN